MKSRARAGWWLVLMTILTLWSMAAMAPVTASAAEGFGVLQWKSA